MTRSVRVRTRGMAALAILFAGCSALPGNRSRADLRDAAICRQSPFALFLDCEPGEVRLASGARVLWCAAPDDPDMRGARRGGSAPGEIPRWGGSPGWGYERAGVSTRVDLPEMRVQSGEPVVVELQIRNRAREAICLDRADVGPWLLEVRDADGEEVEPIVFSINQVSVPFAILPARIEKLLPDDRRITVRSERIIEAIEARIRPLSAEEKGEIRRADRQRRDALGNLRRPSR